MENQQRGSSLVVLVLIPLPYLHFGFTSNSTNYQLEPGGYSEL